MPGHIVRLLHGLLRSTVLNANEWRAVMRMKNFAWLVTIACVGCSEPQNIKFLNQLADGGVPCTDAGNVGEVCSVGQGACERAGTYQCLHGAVTCSATSGTPSTELCDSKQDEDCDGTVDEAPDSGCCADSDCASLEVCERPSGDALAGGSCKAAGDPHADCKYDAHHKIVCTCQKGYEGDGKTCERNACVPLGDDPPPCGAHQTCTPTDPGKKTCACAKSFSDCDASATNGCEVALDTDTKNCGACGVACGDGISCKAGACVPHVAQASMGYWGTLAVTPDRKVLGWGAPAILYENMNTVTTPTLLNVGRAKQVSQGESYGCIIRDGGGSIVCWGKNTSNQLGLADTDLDYADISIANVASIAAGQFNTCVVAGADGKVFCWGTAGSGILGSSTTSLPYDASTSIAGISDATDVKLGTTFACALTKAGKVYCWGSDGGTKYAPELVRDLAGGQAVLDQVVALSTGIGHACALRKDDSLVCWGANDTGQLGNGSTTKIARNRYITVDVDGEPISTFVCGGAHTCAVTTSGVLYCWGANNQAQLGTATASYQPSAWPLKNDVLKDVVALHSGFGAAHSCASIRDGRLYCWGYNYYCNLGAGNCPNGGPEVTPIEVTAWP